VYKQEDGTETFWLLDLLPEILPQARVLSFGYDASDALASPLDDIASKFLHEIIQVKGKTEVNLWSYTIFSTNNFRLNTGP